MKTIQVTIPEEVVEYQFRPILCLDLDGTIRFSLSGKQFIDGPDDIGIYPDIKGKLQEYVDSEYLLIGITNQGGVAYGYKTADQATQENLRTHSLLEGQLMTIFNCNTHPGGSITPYNYRSLMRKPYYGLLVRAEIVLYEELNIIPDWDNSIFVGDRQEDADCATAAGIKFIHADEFFGRSHTDVPTPHWST